jgi:hypothetical protein
LTKHALPVAIVLGILVLATATPSRVRAVDHDIVIRCEDSCEVTLNPDPIVIVAGRDRIRWVMPTRCDPSVCPDFYSVMSIGACVISYPPINRCVWLSALGGETSFVGPFCGVGTMPYFIDGRSSHGGPVLGRPGEIRIEAPPENERATDVLLPWIGVFGDSAATTCSLDGDSREWSRAWVYAILGEGTYCPLGGVSLRIQGFPTPWSYVLHANSNADLVDGDLLGQGARLVFPECSTTERRVLLYTIDYWAGGGPPYSIEVLGPYPLSDPTVTWCQTSGRVEQPVIGAHAFFDRNLPCRAPGPSTATRFLGWSGVKTLFR